MPKKLWNKDFILMLQGNAVSDLGDLLYGVAIGCWVYETTGSSALMGIMSSISMFMTMIVMPFSGCIADRCNRKLMIVGMDVLRGAIMLAVGALAYFGALSIPVVLLAAFLASACSVFFNPAVSTLMIDLIPHDDMIRGQSIDSGINTFIGLVGKALSGMLVAACGVPLIIALNGFSYLFSAVTELFIHVPKTKSQGELVTVKGVFRDFGQALQAILRDNFMRLCIPGCLIINFLGAGAMSLMLPFVLEKGFTVDMYGYLMSVETGASLLCVCFLGVVKLSPRVRYYACGFGFAASVFLMIGAYLATDFIPMCVMTALACFCNTLGNAILNASLVLALPEENRGGILGLFAAGATGGSAISAVVYGIFCDIFPVYLVFTVGSALSFLPIVWMFFNSRSKEFILTH